MSAFDLLFIILFLTTAATLLTAVATAWRGNRGRAGTLLRRLGIGAVLYFAVLLLVSAFTPQRYLGRGERECSDDWCIAVQAAGRTRMADGLHYEVTLELSSRARRVPQRERFVAVYLRDADGRRYPPVADPGAVPFDTLLQPGQAVAALRRFAVPADARILGLVVTRTGFAGPGCCIIGDDASLLHRRTILKLD